MNCDRTSIATLVLHTGALRVDETDERRVFRSLVSFSDDLDPGFVVCRLPAHVESNIHYRLGRGLQKLFLPVILLITLRRTLP